RKSYNPVPGAETIMDEVHNRGETDQPREPAVPSDVTRTAAREGMPQGEALPEGDQQTPRQQAGQNDSTGLREVQTSLDRLLEGVRSGEGSTENLKEGYEQARDHFVELRDAIEGQLVRLDDTFRELGRELRARDASESAATFSKRYADFADDYLSGRTPADQLEATHAQLSTDTRGLQNAIQQHRSLLGEDAAEAQGPLTRQVEALRVPDNPQAAGLPDDIQARLDALKPVLLGDIGRRYYDSGLYFPDNRDMWTGLREELNDRPTIQALTPER
ncbi:MAG: hypothetical protein J2P36_34550, partial [Ktedonobacteraceae bacterium]|nr:hypothetical protein [Ktedonobacteraceae bacterium]